MWCIMGIFDNRSVLIISILFISFELFFFKDVATDRLAKTRYGVIKAYSVQQLISCGTEEEGCSPHSVDVAWRKLDDTMGNQAG